MASLRSFFRAIRAATLPTAWALPAAAHACPDCPVALAVRASFFDQRFWGFFGVLLAPLLVACAMAGLAYRVGQPGRASTTGARR
jgi:hypothetical protein